MSLKFVCTKFQQVNATTKRSLIKSIKKLMRRKSSVSGSYCLYAKRKRTNTFSSSEGEKTQRNLHIFHPLPTLLTAGLPLTDGGTLQFSRRLRCKITIWIHARCTERGSRGRRINTQLFHYTWCDFAHHANQMLNLLTGRVQKSGNLVVLQPRLASGF